MKQFAKPALFALPGFGLAVISLLATIVTGRYFGVPQLLFIVGMGVMLFGVLLAYIRRSGSGVRA